VTILFLAGSVVFASKARVRPNVEAAEPVRLPQRPSTRTPTPPTPPDVVALVAPESQVVEFYSPAASGGPAPAADPLAARAWAASLGAPEAVELAAAANYLDAPGLLGATVRSLGALLANRDPDGVREALGVVTPFEPGEVEAALQRNQWSAVPARAKPGQDK